MAEEAPGKKAPGCRPRSSTYPPIFRRLCEENKWIKCPAELEGQHLVRQFSRFHSHMMDNPSSRVTSAAHSAFAAEQPSLGLIEKRWAEEEVTDSKSSSLDLVHDMASFEQFIIL